jgi:glycosyltransferase involved in cell wall biosynthesis
MTVSVDIVVPVLNEEVALPICIQKLYAFVGQYPERDWRIVVADNGSTDATTEIATELAVEHSTLSVSRLNQRGRGRALKKAWSESDADVRLYMDVDLSTDLSALPPLVAAIAEEGYQVAVGSRLTNSSKVVARTLRREITSRGYNILIHILFPFSGFNDAQCGFKAVSRTTVENLIPLVADNAWFFDTELLLLACKAGYRIKEIPVYWEDDPDTRVNIVSTALEDLKGLLRLRFKGRRTPSSTA